MSCHTRCILREWQVKLIKFIFKNGNRLTCLNYSCLKGPHDLCKRKLLQWLCSRYIRQKANICVCVFLFVLRNTNIKKAKSWFGGYHVIWRLKTMFWLSLVSKLWNVIKRCTTHLLVVIRQMYVYDWQIWLYWVASINYKSWSDAIIPFSIWARIRPQNEWGQEYMHRRHTVLSNHFVVDGNRYSSVR